MLPGDLMKVFSDREMELLDKTGNFDDNYTAVLRSRIRKKAMDMRTALIDVRTYDPDLLPWNLRHAKL